MHTPLLLLFGVAGIAAQKCRDTCEGENTDPVCACGADYFSKCFAVCGKFDEEEILTGSCDEVFCDSVNNCAGQNGFCNWYSFQEFPIPCDPLMDGARCVKPSLLKACFEGSGSIENPAESTWVCGKGNMFNWNFPNPCFAVGAGFPDYTLGNCTDGITANENEMQTFGIAPGNSNDVPLLGGFPYGTFVPYFTAYHPATPNEDHCGCDFNWDPVCLKTGLVDYTFMNQCLADCRKVSQVTSVSQIYYPPTATIEAGECVEPCAGVVCPQNQVCSTQNAGSAICVPKDQDQCMDMCLAKPEDTRICIQQWLRSNSALWHNHNRCHAVECLGVPATHRFEGLCEDRCMATECEPGDTELEVCVWVEATGLRETQNKCTAKCAGFTLFLDGPCGVDTCALACPIEENENVCVDGKDYLSRCEYQCAGGTIAGLLGVTIGETCEEAGFIATPAPGECSTVTDGCCDVVPDIPISNYGNCANYAKGTENHEFCDQDGVVEQFSKFYANVGEACPLSCCKCGDCANAEFCSETTPDCCDLVSEDSQVSNYGDCKSYQAGGTNNGLCDDAVIPSLANLGATAGDVCKASCDQCAGPTCNGECCDLTPPGFNVNNYGDCKSYAEGGSNAGFCGSDKTNDGTDVSQACAASCNTCGGVAANCNADETCCDATPPGAPATNYGGCDKYAKGAEYENFCTQDTALSAYGGALVNAEACKFSCDNCGDSSACTGSCCDVEGPVSSYGGCKEYAFEANIIYCDVDVATLVSDDPTALVQEFCPVTCGICTPDSGTECVDSTNQQISIYGSCATYAEGEANHQYCESDGLAEFGKCPVACKLEACLGACADKISGLVSDWGDCVSYADGGNNAGFCEDPTNGAALAAGHSQVKEACPLSCNTC